MSEIRLYITTTEKKADAALSLMTDAFEEDGFAIATMEIDEKRDIWEASVYMFREDEDAVRERFDVRLTAEPQLVGFERHEIESLVAS